MIKLNFEEFHKVNRLIKSNNELTVQSVINGCNPGEVFVNDRDNPTAVLIKTNECNLIAGDITDEKFNSQVSTEIDFWDQLNPDNLEWEVMIPKIHKNKFIRKYKRRRYVLEKDYFKERKIELEENIKVEHVDLELMKKDILDNSEDVMEWIEDGWGEEDNFKNHGAGFIIRDDENIMSWSIADCAFEDKIAIGIHTDHRFRKKGLAIAAASETIKECFDKGYKKIEWSCVDTNKGSIAIAEKLGFKCESVYDSFTSYPPIENIMDLNQGEWCEWGDYLNTASSIEKEMKIDALHSYIKGNNVSKSIDIIKDIEVNDIDMEYDKLHGWILNLQKHGLCSEFSDSRWTDFIKKYI